MEQPSREELKLRLQRKLLLATNSRLSSRAKDQKLERVQAIVQQKLEEEKQKKQEEEERQKRLKEKKKEKKKKYLERKKEKSIVDLSS